MSESDIDVLQRLLSSRYSARAFSPDPLPQELIEEMFAAAQRTATWCNTQPWQVIVTSGEGTERFRKALYEGAATAESECFDFDPPAEYRGVYGERRRETGFALYNAVGIGRKDYAARTKQGLENFRFFGAPHAAIITSDASLGTYGVLDVGGYVANVVNAAQALGIALIPQAALASRSDVVRQHFDLPEDRRIVVGLSFGYADDEHPINGFRTSRASLDEAITWADQ